MMWEYEEAKRQAQHKARLAGFNFPHNPEREARVAAELLAEAENTALRKHLAELAF